MHLVYALNLHIWLVLQLIWQRCDDNLLLSCCRFPSGLSGVILWTDGMPLSGRAGETVPGADLLAGVAAVEAVTEAGGLFDGDFSAVLDGEIGEAFAGVQMAGAFQCSCRAGIQATGTTAATVLLRCVVMIRFEGGDNFSQEEERTFTGNNQVRVLPDPAQSGFPSPIAFEDRSGVGEKAGGSCVCLSRSRVRQQCGPQVIPASLL